MDDEVNLNLNQVIRTIMMCGSVTEAARMLKTTPASILYQLAKVRNITSSEVFVQTKLGTSPEPEVLELSEKYQQYGNAYSSMQGAENSLPREVVVNSWPLFEMLYLQSAADESSPSLTVQYKFQSYINDIDDRVNALMSCMVDIDIGSRLSPIEGITVIQLFSSGVTVLTGKLREYGNGQLTQQEWETMDHAVWAGSADFYSEYIEDSIRAARFMASRNVKFISTNMFNIASLCENKEYILLVPNVFAPIIMKMFSLQCLSLPTGLNLKSDFYLHFQDKLAQEPALLKSVGDVIAKLQKTFFSQYPVNEGSVEM